MPPHELNVKNDSIIILQRNLNTQLGFCNGTRLKVIKCLENIIEAECLRSGRKCFIPRIPMSNKLQQYPFELKRIQFPIRLGYAITINKSQGQTLDRVGVFLPQPVFTHGQLYVALSRVRSIKNLKVLILDTPAHGRLTINQNNIYSNNIVYREVLTEIPLIQPIINLNYTNEKEMEIIQTYLNNIDYIINENIN